MSTLKSSKVIPMPGPALPKPKAGADLWSDITETQKTRDYVELHEARAGLLSVRVGRTGGGWVYTCNKTSTKNVELAATSLRAAKLEAATQVEASVRTMLGAATDLVVLLRDQRRSASALRGGLRAR